MLATRICKDSIKRKKPILKFNLFKKKIIVFLLSLEDLTLIDTARTDYENS